MATPKITLGPEVFDEWVASRPAKAPACTCSQDNHRGWELAMRLSNQLAAAERALVIIAHMDPTEGAELAAEAKVALVEVQKLRTS